MKFKPHGSLTLSMSIRSLMNYGKISGITKISVVVQCLFLYRFDFSCIKSNRLCIIIQPINGIKLAAILLSSVFWVLCHMWICVLFVWEEFGARNATSCVWWRRQRNQRKSNEKPKIPIKNHPKKPNRNETVEKTAYCSHIKTLSSFTKSVRKTRTQNERECETSAWNKNGKIEEITPNCSKVNENVSK